MASKQLLFPFPENLISKDEIPWPSTNSSDYSVRGIANAPDLTHPLHYCCWIEASMHVLLRDPCIQYFVKDFSEKDSRSFPLERTDKPDEAKLYTLGSIAMQILSCRLRSDSMYLPIYRNRMTELYAEFRANAVIKSSSASSSVNAEDMCGDAAAAISVVLDALRCYIAFNWQGSLFQAQFLAYGSFPVICRTEMCMRSECARYLNRTVYGVDRTIESLDNLVMVPDIESTIRIPVTETPTSLALQLNNKFDGRWRTKKASCREIDSQGSCLNATIMQRQLKTLPWLLYLSIQRDPTAATPLELHYSTDELLLGPTADGQYATYRLLARVNYGHMHFTADVRRGGGAAYRFRNWNFENQSDVNLSGAAVDKDSVFLLWQRTQ